MRLLNTREVKIGDNIFHIKITNRAMIEYQNLTSDLSLYLSTHDNLIKLFYCTAKAGAKAEGLEFKYTFDEFLDVIDMFYNDTASNFSSALAEEFTEFTEKKNQNPQK